MTRAGAAESPDSISNRAVLAPKLKLNILANFAGQGWSALMRLAFVPIYLRMLGVEAYGLIGFYALLQTAIQILDLGLSPTMSREMARYLEFPEKASEARDFVRTLELGYWGIGLAIGLVISLLAPFISHHLFRASTLSTGVIQKSVMIMGIVTALQWPISFYQGGLMGLQRQVIMNKLKIAMDTLQYAGAVFILVFVAPTITAFFAWQIFTSAVYAGVITVLLWRNLPVARQKPRMRVELAARIGRFAVGMSGITLSGILLMQLDKWILIKSVSLSSFGYYTLAGTAAGGLYMFISPLFAALFPRFSSLVARGDDAPLISLYHKASQLMAVIVLPVAVILIFFPRDALFVWTGQFEMATKAAPVLAFLAAGNALNGIMNLPYALQLANGWTSLGLRINAFLIALMIPSLLFFIHRYGPMGAAATWFGMGVCYLIVGVPLTHRRLLRGEMKSWFFDLARIFVAAMTVAGAAKILLLHASLGRFPLAAFLAASCGAAMTASISVAPLVREAAIAQLKSFVPQT